MSLQSSAWEVCLQLELQQPSRIQPSYTVGPAMMLFLQMMEYGVD